jgi:hypothetical protein
MFAGATAEHLQAHEPRLNRLRDDIGVLILDAIAKSTVSERFWLGLRQRTNDAYTEDAREWALRARELLHQAVKPRQERSYYVSKAENQDPVLHIVEAPSEHSKPLPSPQQISQNESRAMTVNCVVHRAHSGNLKVRPQEDSPFLFPCAGVFFFVLISSSLQGEDDYCLNIQHGEKNVYHIKKLPEVQQQKARRRLLVLCAATLRCLTILFIYSSMAV